MLLPHLSLILLLASKVSRKQSSPFVIGNGTQPMPSVGFRLKNWTLWHFINKRNCCHIKRDSLQWTGGLQFANSQCVQSKSLTHSVASFFGLLFRKSGQKKQKVKMEIRSYLDLTFRWTEMSIAELMQRKWPIFLNHFRGWSQSYKITFVTKMLQYPL